MEAIDAAEAHLQQMIQAARTVVSDTLDLPPGLQGPISPLLREMSPIRPSRAPPIPPTVDPRSPIKRHPAAAPTLNGMKPPLPLPSPHAPGSPATSPLKSPVRPASPLCQFSLHYSVEQEQIQAEVEKHHALSGTLDKLAAPGLGPSPDQRRRQLLHAMRESEVAAMRTEERW